MLQVLPDTCERTLITGLHLVRAQITRGAGTARTARALHKLRPLEAALLGERNPQRQPLPVRPLIVAGVHNPAAMLRYVLFKSINDHLHGLLLAVFAADVFLLPVTFPPDVLNPGSNNLRR